MKDDLISRSALLEKLADVIREMPIPKELYEDGILGGLGTAFSMIENAPAVDAEPVVHAHWERVIPTKSAAKWSTKVSCSNCHREGYTRYPRCPNCGAYMSEK